jgi:lipopolysaccharide biosynthesis regulator YciM
MSQLLKDPKQIPDRTFFEASQYYLNNGENLNIALEWINAALEKSKNNFRYGLLKSKIQNKMGDKKSALQTISEALLWARRANNSNYIEQTELFKKQLLNN